jgi:hypothetical protein
MALEPITRSAPPTDEEIGNLVREELTSWPAGGLPERYQPRPRAGFFKGWLRWLPVRLLRSPRAPRE